MKKIQQHIASLFACMLLTTACDNGFDELNINKISPTVVDPSYLMNNAVILGTFAPETLPYELAIVQQIVTPNSGVVAGGNFNIDNRPVTLGNWVKYYRDVLRYTRDVRTKTETVAERSNLYNMARIWSVLATMILTDTYGDVPYQQASLGYLEEIVAPAYDTQEVIYGGILTELEQATAALDASKRIESGDVLYGGSVEKWKRLGYSLMLRAAMRLSKVDAASAASFVDKAVAGGVMQSNDDNAVVRHDFNYLNNVGNALNATEANNYYLAAPFLNFLKDSNDPRLTSIAVRYEGAKSGPDQNNTVAGTPPAHVTLTRAAEDQVGMPMGYDNTTIVPVVEDLGLASFYDFSQLDRTRMGARNAPAYLVTYAQTKLLLAEAVVRGWADGDAADFYRDGVEAHMQQLSGYGASSAVDPDAIQTYLDANPLDLGNAYEEINTQYWVASFLNGPETFANFRRSGFPALTPNTYKGDIPVGTFVRRLTYPDPEFSVNNANVQAAIAHQGADKLDTRVWWDVQ